MQEKSKDMMPRQAVQEAMRRILGTMYSAEDAERALHGILSCIDKYGWDRNHHGEAWSESDAVLITYADSITKKGQKPLATLRNFYSEHLQESFSHVHLLPFFPYSSDDGFSITDFYSVNPRLGTWKDIERLGEEAGLMFDFVLNHVSARSRWFKQYLAAKEGYRSLAVEVPEDTDLSMVFRPRALPLCTPVAKKDGTGVHVWTTFSSDQIDLNYKSVDVLLRMIDVLLFYVSKGASIIRLDAIAYAWKEPGTPCIHLPEAHALVKLIRLAAGAVSTACRILTETNVPHKDNVSYFGSGHDEAHMVYNFSLPPLVLYTFITGDTSVLLHWSKTLKAPCPETSFFNFTASHDGIGILPLKEYVPERDFSAVIDHVRRNGGAVSYKSINDSKAPYELNVSFIDAIAGPQDSPASLARRFLASQSIALVLPGIPAVYIHSLLGSRNWYRGVEQTGMLRSINREKLRAEAVLQEISDRKTFRGMIFSAYTRMLALRRSLPAFSPAAMCEPFFASPQVFGVKRRTHRQTIYAYTNVTDRQVRVELPQGHTAGQGRTVLGTAVFRDGSAVLQPFEVCWMVYDHK